MPRTALEHYRVMQRLVAITVAGVQRRRGGTLTQLALFVAVMQVVAAKQGADSVTEMVDEQGLDPALVALVVAEAFAGATPNGAPLETLLRAVTAPGVPKTALGRLVVTLIADAGRAGQSVATVATPSVTGHVRYLNPPSCARCAILAGRWYRWSEGFLRHPN